MSMMSSMMMHSLLATSPTRFRLMLEEVVCLIVIASETFSTPGERGKTVKSRGGTASRAHSHHVPPSPGELAEEGCSRGFGTRGGFATHPFR